jgi:hypothetical protein
MHGDKSQHERDYVLRGMHNFISLFKQQSEIGMSFFTPDP